MNRRANAARDTRRPRPTATRSERGAHHRVAPGPVPPRHRGFGAGEPGPQGADEHQVEQAIEHRGPAGLVPGELCEAAVVELDDPEARRLAAAGALKAITSHGALELPDGCFLRVRLRRRVPTYGLGMSLLQLLKDPLAAGRVAEVDWGVAS